MEAWVDPGVATTEVGAPGVVEGITAFDAVEYAPGPSAVTAATSKM
jgi:hypothetical protein